MNISLLENCSTNVKKARHCVLNQPFLRRAVLAIFQRHAEISRLKIWCKGADRAVAFQASVASGIKGERKPSQNRGEDSIWRP
jgi:hypothetical protein